MHENSKLLRHQSGLLSSSIAAYHNQLHSPIVRSKSALTAFTLGHRGTHPKPKRPPSNSGTGCSTMKDRMNRLKGFSRPRSSSGDSGAYSRPLTPPPGATTLINNANISSGSPLLARSGSSPARMKGNKAANSELFKRSPVRTPSLMEPLKGLKLPQLNDGTESPTSSPCPSPNPNPSTKINHKQKIILTEPSTLKFGVSSVRGKRNYMEDEYKIVENLVDAYSTAITEDNSRHATASPSSMDASKSTDESAEVRTLFFGVYDGHAGKRCSHRISRHIPLLLSRHPLFYKDLPRALTETYLHVDEKFLSWARRHNYPDGSTACTVLRRGETLFICNTGDSRAILSQNVSSFVRFFFNVFVFLSAGWISAWTITAQNGSQWRMCAVSWCMHLFLHHNISQHLHHNIS